MSVIYIGFPLKTLEEAIQTCHQNQKYLGQPTCDVEAVVTPDAAVAPNAAAADPVALPKLLTFQQLSEYLGVSRTTLNNWIKQGRLKPIRFSGGVVRFDPTTLQEVAVSRGFLPRPGRPRKTEGTTVRERVLNAIPAIAAASEDGAAHVKQIAFNTGIKLTSVEATMYRLHDAGLVVKTGPRLWRLVQQQ